MLWLAILVLAGFLDAQVDNSTVTSVDPVISIDSNAGITVRLNQRGLDYITELASDAFPRILNNLNPADKTVDKIRLWETLVHEVTKPNITAKFLEGKGVRAHLRFPCIRLSTKAEVSVWLFQYDGSFIADLHNLTIKMDIHYSRNETTQRNNITAPSCEVTYSEMGLVFNADNGLSALRQEIEHGAIDAVRTAICETAIEALEYMDEQDISRSYSQPSQQEEGGFDPAELGLSLCKPESLLPETTPSGPTTTSTEKLEDTVTPSATWGANLTLVYPPTFGKNDVIFGVDGGITLNGSNAIETARPPRLNTTEMNDKMVGILVSEYVPNTLFSLLYDYQLGTFYNRFTPEDLPKFLKKAGKMMCSKCFLDVTATLTDKPFIEIDGVLGARVKLAANVSILFQGRQEQHKLIHATTLLHVTLKPTIRHSRIYGDVSLANVDVNVFEMGVGGVLASPLEKIISVIVPKVLWPQVKKRLRFALNRRGVQLPVLCGVELEHLSLRYIDHALILDTDFTFDISMFEKKFKSYLAYKAMTNPNLPRYAE